MCWDKLIDAYYRLKIYNLEVEFRNFLEYYAKKFELMFKKIEEYWNCIAIASIKNVLWREVVIGINELEKFENICIIIVGIPTLTRDYAITLRPIVINNTVVYTIALTFTEFIAYHRFVKEYLHNVIDVNTYTISTLMHEYFHYPSPYRKLLTHKNFESMLKTINKICSNILWNFTFSSDPFLDYNIDIVSLASKLYSRILHLGIEAFINLIYSKEYIKRMKYLGLVVEHCFKLKIKRGLTR